MGLAISRNTKNGKELTRQGVSICNWIFDNTHVDKITKNNIKIYMTEIIGDLFNVDNADELRFDNEIIFKFCNLLMIQPLQFQKTVVVSMGVSDEETIDSDLVQSTMLPTFISSERRTVDIMVPTRVERDWGDEIVDMPGTKEILVNTYEIRVKKAYKPYKVELNYDGSTCFISIDSDLGDELQMGVVNKLYEQLIKTILSKYEKVKKGKAGWIDPQVERVEEFTLYPPEGSERIAFNKLKSFAKRNVSIITAPVRDTEFSTGAIKFGRGRKF